MALNIMFANKVVQYTIELLSTHNIMHIMFIINMIIFTIGIIENYLFLKILKDTDYNIINYYLYTIFGRLIMNHMVKIYTSRKVSKLRLYYKQSCFEKYQNLSHDSKEKINENTFNEKTDRSWNSISSIISHGIPRIINISKSIYLVIMSFFMVGEINRIIIISIFYIFYYLIVYRKMATNRMNINNKIRKNRKKTESELSFKLPFFKYNQIDINDIMNIFIHNNNVFNEWENTESNFQSLLSLQNNIGVALIIINNQLASVTLLINVFKDFNDSVIELIYFADWFQSLNNDFLTYEELYNDLISMPLPTQYNLPNEGIVIDNIDITRGDFHFKSKVNILLKKGQRILIQGPSGGGKSTFMDGILGKIKGVHLTNNIDPIHYQTKFIELYQKIRDGLPTSNITIRYMFFGANDEIIKECLNLVCLNKFTDYDCDLNDKVSGGEKQRLCIAIQLYRIIKTQNEYIIMDEPEQGSDPKLAYDIINNIMKHFNDKCFIIVSHAENINNELYYDYKWDKKLIIENGTIRNV